MPFTVPSVRLYRSDHLGQGERPGFMAYGYDYEVGFYFRTGLGLWGESLASLENRIGANVFRLAGKSLLEWGGAKTQPQLPDFNYETLHDARIQSQRIGQLPTLAEGMIRYSRLPWHDQDRRDPDTPAPTPWQVDRRQLKSSLLSLSAGLLDVTSTLKRETTLLPTRMGGPDERYVSTAEEAALIRLALELNESAIAEEVLRFFWKKSRGGHGGRSQRSRRDGPGEHRGLFKWSCPTRYAGC